MLAKRIIPCLDIKGNQVVKGVRFEDLAVVADPIERARHYDQLGADELCFLDVRASIDGSDLLIRLMERVAEEISIPFCVGGGVKSASDGFNLLRAGADKVAVNSAALSRPELIDELAAEFGSQCVVLSVDTRATDGDWMVTTHGGTRLHERRCLDWIDEATSRGAGEILLNVINADGTRDGFATAITAEVADRVRVPVIASGGAGSAQDFVTLFEHTQASAALAASIFHDDSCSPNDIKMALKSRGIPVRL
ncbi:MAG: imidazole glycerol phosphate synthase subunit HisF [Phycisphaerae bacterium]